MLNNSNKKKIFVIAEIGNNHEGNFNLAKKLIQLAAKSGVDAVKFQTFKTENYINISQKKKIKQLKKFQFSHEQFKRLKNFANKNNLLFISTPFDIESAIFLKKICDIIKISSGDNNFFYMIDELLKSKKKIIISTGMTSMNDIKLIMSFLRKRLSFSQIRKKIYFLHCVSSYPAQAQDLNLLSIKYLREKLGIKVGYSDHSKGPIAAITAGMLGAEIIEKHFTIDKKYSKFRDHSLSADFEEMKFIIESFKNIKVMLGKYTKEIHKSERSNLSSMRRSPYASVDIEKGEILSNKNVIFQRPRMKGTSLNHLKIFGKKINKKIKKYTLIKNKNII
jgi:N,N'-diacetyllegionaminate synthase